jgi:membrane associated rhomboid family serine protease
MSLPEEKKRLSTSIYFALIVVAMLWLVKAVELIGGISFATFGVMPLKLKGLAGILLSPLIHADMGHLTANSAPMFFLTAALVYFYRKDAIRIFSILWILTGLWVWLFARGNSYHIGASGVVYGLAAFHLIGGIIRKEPRLMAFSMLVIFLYGSMVWGFFPDFFPKKNISWESHLMGAIAGVLLGIYYRKAGPQAKVYDWGEEDEDEMNDEVEVKIEDEPNKGSNEQAETIAATATQEENQPTTDTNPYNILYHYKPKG